MRLGYRRRSPIYDTDIWSRANDDLYQAGQSVEKRALRDTTLPYRI